LAEASALGALAGEPIAVDLTAEGPWMPPLTPTPTPAQALQPDGLSHAPAVPALPADSLTGTVTLRNANWKADYLANHVEISQATLHLGSGELRWDPVVFSYGPVKGTASLSLPAACQGPQPCTPTFQIQFDALDSSVLQAAFLGAHERGTVLSTLIGRLRPSTAPAWPQLTGTVQAESLVLGPVTLHKPSATLHMVADGAEITAFDADLLGGRIHGSGTLRTAQTAKDKPSYTLEGQLEKLSSQALGQMLGLRSSGGVFDGSGKLQLTGFTGDDLAASASGTLHFDWAHGSVGAASGLAGVPEALARFDRWTGDAVIANGVLTLKDNQVKRGVHTEPVQATVTLAERPKLTLIMPRTIQAKR
jgi:polyisoprenoid-binding protein YceI